MILKKTLMFGPMIFIHKRERVKQRCNLGWYCSYWQKRG